MSKSDKFFKRLNTRHIKTLAVAFACVLGVMIAIIVPTLGLNTIADDNNTNTDASNYDQTSQTVPGVARIFMLQRYALMIVGEENDAFLQLDNMDAIVELTISNPSVARVNSPFSVVALAEGWTGITITVRVYVNGDTEYRTRTLDLTVIKSDIIEFA